MAEPAVSGRPAEFLRITESRRRGNATGSHLKRAVRPALRLLDRRPPLRIVRQQPRLRVALLEESRDPVIGRDALAIGVKRRDGAEHVAHPQAERALAAGRPRLAARIEPVQTRHHRMQQRDELGPLVGTPLCSSISIAERHACEPGMT